MPCKGCGKNKDANRYERDKQAALKKKAEREAKQQATSRSSA